MTAALVTGGAGFVGSHVADELIALGMDVVVMDDLSGGYRRNIPERAVFVEASIEDTEAIERVFARYRFDYIFHLAAYAAEGLSHFIRQYNYRVNLVGSVNLINAAVKFQSKCFVFTSSIAVYGSALPPFREEDPVHPEDPYGIAKAAVEQDLRAAWEIFGLPYIIFRPHNVYGERQNLSDPYRNVIGIFINQALAGSPCTIFGDGRQTRAFSYIGDVAPIIAGSVEVAAARNEIFNIGAERELTVAELAAEVQKAVGNDVGIEWLAARHEALHAHSSHAKADRVFGRRASTDLADGIARMSAWAKSINPRELRPFANIEIRQNLPERWSTFMDG